jgi:hypothetical protein
MFAVQHPASEATPLPESNGPAQPQKRTSEAA